MCAINGTRSAPEAKYDLVVIGAGPSGIAAAIEGAASGASVLLVDENPVSGALMGNDTPLYFGGRITAATQNSDRMLEAIFMSMPDLEKAMEAGVELLLGTTAWGVYRNGPGVQSLPEQVVGLADAERSWLVGFDRIVLATGARDLAIAFPGWNQPGVMGAAALQMLLSRYGAFSGRRIVVLGSHDLALETALMAQEHGLDVAGLVEVRDGPQGDAALLAKITAAGIATHHIKAGKIDLRIPLAMVLAGIPAVLVAAFIVKELPLAPLKWLVSVVISYTGIVMLRSAAIGRRAEAENAAAPPAAT